MNYELVKQLKDSGFPQKGKGDYFKPPREELLIESGEVNFTDNAFIQSAIYTIPARRGYVYVPTLSELIDACHGKLHCLIYNEEKNFWSAGTTSEVKDWHNYKTPEEAVAKLWLELNKDDNKKETTK